MSIGIKVVGDRVLATAIPKQEQKKGILILEDVKPNEDIVRVVAIAQDSPVSIGDKIVIGGSWHQKINYNDQELIVVNRQDILGVIDETV